MIGQPVTGLEDTFILPCRPYRGPSFSESSQSGPSPPRRRRHQCSLLSAYCNKLSPISRLSSTEHARDILFQIIYK